MGKLKNGLVREHRENCEKEKKQEQLRNKHHIEDQDVVIVEKANTVTYMVKAISGTIRLVASIAILLLALIGLCAILYPLPRYELQRVWQDIWNQLQLLV